MASRRLAAAGRLLAAAPFRSPSTSAGQHGIAATLPSPTMIQQQQSNGRAWNFVAAATAARRAFSSDSVPRLVLGMPALSPTMAQGNIVTWKKKEGDQVLPGDVLCVIETDKATVDFESVEEGYLAKILLPAGTNNVQVGQVIGIMAESIEDVPKLANENASSCSSSSPAPTAATAQTSQPPLSGLPPHIVLGMPAMSPTMAQGNIIEWKKKEGDQVSPGEALCTIETDKATVDFESTEEGYLAKVLLPGGSRNVQIGQTIGILVESAGDVAKFANADFGAPASSSSPKAPSSTVKPPVASSPRLPTRLSPSVRRLLAESRGLDVSSIPGTGPRGLVLKGDVLAALKNEAKSPRKAVDKDKGAAVNAAAASFEDQPTSQIRRVIAKRLQESKRGIPHFYLRTDAVLDNTLALRKEIKEKHDVSVSVNDFVIRATALALNSVPEANAFWDDKSGEIVLHDSVDISFAVATEKGLITPIIRDANLKPLTAISTEVKSLAEKARNGKLKPAEFQGGTFSISNLGMFEVDSFCAIVNPPQACILAVGRGQKNVVWDEVVGTPNTVTKVALTLSADNRVYDADVAGRFLEALSAYLEDPKRMLL